MSRQIQIRRGSAAENDSFTGAIGEITMDTTNNTLRVHDGITTGGTKLAKQSEIPAPYTMPINYDFVIDFQEPSSSNNYTWYRLYKSGWVEQGSFSNLANNVRTNITLPIALQGANFVFPQISNTQAGFGSQDTLSIQLSTDGTYVIVFQKNASSASMYICWEIKGMKKN